LAAIGSRPAPEPGIVRPGQNPSRAPTASASPQTLDWTWPTVAGVRSYRSWARVGAKATRPSAGRAEPGSRSAGSRVQPTSSPIALSQPWLMQSRQHDSSMRDRCRCLGGSLSVPGQGEQLVRSFRSFACPGPDRLPLLQQVPLARRLDWSGGIGGSRAILSSWGLPDGIRKLGVRCEDPSD
jgi:hypothetical protein